MEAVQQAIRTVWSQYFPNDTLDIRRPKTYIERSYATDVQLAKMLSAASVVAIAIAAFGIYVLSAYSVRRRAKEIVLRKLHGAGRMAIGYLVGREFLILIVISALIGLPVAAITSERFLAGFVERAPSGTWALPISFAIAVLVAMVSTLRHTVTALRMSPAEVFRE